jgi:hypothetical protein
MSKWIRRGVVPSLCLLAGAASGCGDFVRQGWGPSLATVAVLEAASGAEPARFGGTLGSDVVTYVKKTIDGAEVRVPTIFSDSGRATLSVEPKDPSITEPSALNAVTFTRYRVVYRRADGRNTPGVDVPFPFDSAVTVTVNPGSTAQAGFDIVRVVAKGEAPLVGLVNSQEFISTIADITFYGKDHAGNDVSATGSIGITFGNFGDPD